MPEDTPSPSPANPVSNLLKREAAKWFGGDEAALELFLRSWASGQAGRPALVWRDDTPASDALWERLAPPPWSPPWVWSLAPGSKAGRHAGHASGLFYPLDLSSVWESMPLSLLAAEPPRRLLDLCAAPGGKTMLAWRWLRPALMISNEVVKARLGPLRHNLGRLRLPGAHTQSMASADWSRQAPEAFDLVLLDAPCSGQSLPAKGVPNPGCFHPATVKGNAGRQKSLLGNAAGCVAPGGHLLYTTCTFSREENEKAVDAFLRRHGGWRAVECPAMEPWRSPLSAFPCFRLYPHQSCGAGGFSCLLRRDGQSGGDLPALDPALLAWPVGGGDSGIR